MNADRALNPTRRVAYAFVGLLGGQCGSASFSSAKRDATPFILARNAHGRTRAPDSDCASVVRSLCGVLICRMAACRVPHCTASPSPLHHKLVVAP